MRKIIFLRKQLEQIIKESVLSAKNNGTEICGLLIDNGYFIEIVSVNNKNKVGGGFEFYVNEVKFIEKAVTKLNHEIIGTFHSHPTYIAKPGTSDIENAVNDSLMLIIDVMDKKTALWHIIDKKIKKRKFELL